MSPKFIIYFINSKLIINTYTGHLPLVIVFVFEYKVFFLVFGDFSSSQSPKYPGAGSVDLALDGGWEMGWNTLEKLLSAAAWMCFDRATPIISEAWLVANTELFSAADESFCSSFAIFLLS